MANDSETTESDNPLDTVEQEGPRHGLLLLACVLLGIPTLLFPGTAPWINDEPVLLYKAIVANHQGSWAKTGLVGSFGLHYSPVIVWLYQLALKCTYDMQWIVFGKSVLSLGATLAAVFLALRRLKLTPWPVLLIPVSPYLWYYHRIPWDNCVLIPVSAWAFVSLISVLQAPNARRLVGLTLCAVLLLHIHLMSVMWIAAAAATVVLAQRKWLREHMGIVGCVVIGAVVAMLPYMLSLRNVEVVRSAGHAPEWLERLTAGFLGGRFFSHVGFSHFVPELYNGSWLAKPLGIGLLVISAAGLLLSGIGVVFGGRLIWERLAKGRCVTAIEDQLLVFAVLCLLALSSFFWISHPIPLPHYFNGMWLPYFYLAWYGAHRLWAVKVVRAATFASVLASAILTLTLAVSLRTNGGNRWIYYGPSLSSQMTLASEVAPHWPRVKVNLNAVPNLKHYPHALDVLIALAKLSQPDAAADGPPVFTVRHRDSPKPDSGHLEWGRE